jgi:hypothetical protein
MAISMCFPLRAVIAWYENDGTGNFGPQLIISSEASGARSARAADFDGDGDLDVVSALRLSNGVAWHENLGGQVFAPQVVITDQTIGIRCVFPSDLDGDGDIDIISASSFDDKIAWYANDGAGNFGPPQMVSLLANSPPSVRTADLDGDGDLDIISASDRDAKIAWYQNNGLGVFGVQQVISLEADAAQSVHPADVDGDGDIDVLSASYFDNKIAWYENDGLGNFGPQQIISTQAEGALFVSAADLDGDGDLDAMSASLLDNKIAWYENLSQSVCNAPLNLDVIEIGFSGSNPEVNLSWDNTNGTANCEVKAGRINTASAATATPVFANLNNTQILTQTTEAGLLFNIGLYDNPTALIIPGAWYGFEVRCTCQNGSGYSPWSGLMPSSVVQIPVLNPVFAPENTQNTSLETGKSIRLYPNPFSATATLDLGGSAGWLGMEIYDLQGRLIRHDKVYSQEGIVRMDRADLVSGSYILRLKTASKSRELLFIVE